MKKLLIGLLGPTLAFASHSLEMGAFYTQHKEKGYTYDFGGLAFSYEIGNSKGLKARGKILTSTNSDLLFVQAQSELLWYIPLYEFHMIPFVGGYATHHNVYKKDAATGVLSRLYAPIGLGFKHDMEELTYEVRIAHHHALSCHYTYDENTEEFWGKKIFLPNAYMVDGKVQYQTGERVNFGLVGRWVSDYRQKMREWATELYVNVGF